MPIVWKCLFRKVTRPWTLALQVVTEIRRLLSVSAVLILMSSECLGRKFGPLVKSLLNFGEHSLPKPGVWKFRFYEVQMWLVLKVKFVVVRVAPVLLNRSELLWCSVSLQPNGVGLFRRSVNSVRPWCDRWHVLWVSVAPWPLLCLLRLPQLNIAWTDLFSVMWRT